MVLKHDDMDLHVQEEEEEEEKKMNEEITHESSHPLSPVILSSEMTSTNQSSTRQSRLSRLSWSAKHSIALNQIESVDISSTYKRPDGVTIYVMDVYLRCFQAGIPSRKSDVREKKRKAEYHLERRFSDFYQLRKQIKNTLISTQDDQLHLRWCPYCSRIDWLVSYGPFPPRCPMGFMNKVIFWKDMVVRQRRTGLTQFINRLVHLAKDSFYRYDREQCDGFVNISFILKDFLFEPSLFDHEAIAF
jgi:hypothetical protein